VYGAVSAGSCWVDAATPRARLLLLLLLPLPLTAPTSSAVLETKRARPAFHCCCGRRCGERRRQYGWLLGPRHAPLLP